MFPFSLPFIVLMMNFIDSIPQTFGFISSELIKKFISPAAFTFYWKKQFWLPFLSFPPFSSFSGKLRSHWAASQKWARVPVEPRLLLQLLPGPTDSITFSPKCVSSTFFSAWEKNGSIWMQLFFFPGWWFELVELVSLVSVHFRDARFDFFVPSSLYWEFHLYSFFSNGWYFYRKIIFFAVLPLSLSFKYSYCYHFSFPFINRRLQLQTVLTTFLVPEKLFSLLHLSEFETVAFFFFFLTWKIFKVEIGSNCLIFFTFPLGNISLCLRCCRCLHPHTCLLLFVFLCPFLCRPIHMCACVC